MNKYEKKVQILQSIPQDWKVMSKFNIYINISMCEKVHEKVHEKSFISRHIYEDFSVYRNLTFIIARNVTIKLNLLSDLTLVSWFIS